MRNGFKPLDLGDQTRFVFERFSGHVAQLARHFHVGGVFRKADSHIVGLEGHGGFDVFHVFAGERRCGQAAALFVDPFVVGQLAAHLHRGVHLFALHLVDRQHNQTVVEQQQVAGFDVARKFFVIKAYTLNIPWRCARGVEHKRLTSLQHDFAFGKFADADFWPLQVGHDGHDAAGAFGRFTHQSGAVDMVLGFAVAEVEPNHIDASANHGFKHFRVAGCRPQRGNDFGGVIWHVCPVKRACIVTRKSCLI